MDNKSHLLARLPAQGTITARASQPGGEKVRFDIGEIGKQVEKFEEMVRENNLK